MSVNEVARPSVILNSQQAEEKLKELKKLSAAAKRELSKIKLKKDPEGHQVKKREIQGIDREIKKLKKSTYNTQTVLRNLNGTSLNNLKKAANGLKSEMYGLNRQTVEYAQKKRAYQQINTEIKKHTRALNNTSTAWGRMKNTASRYFNVVTLGAAAIYGAIAGIKRMIRENIDLSDSFADVMKTSGLSRKEVGELYNDFNKLNTRTARKELLALAEEGGRLGFKTRKELMDFVTVGNQIKTALGDDLGGAAEESIKLVGKLTNIYKVGEKYGVNFKDAMLMVGSSINEVSANSTAQADYLIEIMNRMAGVSDQANLSADSVIGYASVLDQLAQKKEVSGTTMNRVMIDMFKDTALYADVAGMKTSDFAQLLRTDANEAFLLMLDGLNNNNEGFDTMVTKLKSLKLEGVRSIQVLTALAGNTEKIRKEQKLANTALEEGTSLTKEYEIRNNNLAGSWAKIGNYIREKFVNPAAEGWFGRIIGKIAEWTEIPLSDTLREQRSEVNLLIDSAASLNVEDDARLTILNELQSIYPDLLKNMDLEKITNQDLVKLKKEYNDQIRERIKLAVYEEEITEKETKGKELFKTEIKLIKSINAAYNKYALDKKEGASLEEQIAVLQNKEALKSEAIAERKVNAGGRMNSMLKRHLSFYDGIGINIKNYNQNLIDQVENEKEILAIIKKKDDVNKGLNKGGSGGGKKTKTTVAETVGFTPQDVANFWDAVALGIIKGETEIRKLTEEEIKKLGAARKKQLDSEAKFREELIKGSKSLIEQEKAAFEKRKEDAGVAGKDKENWTKDHHKTLEILEQQHQDNIAKINDDAISDDIKRQQTVFNEQTKIRTKKHNEELLAFGNDKEARKKLDEKFKKDELIRNVNFLNHLQNQISNAINNGEWDGINIEDKLLSDQEKENLILKLNEIGLKMSDINLIIDGIDSDDSKDIFGMTQENWDDLLENTAKAMTAISYVGNIWGSLNQRKTNQENKALKLYEKNIKKEKDLLNEKLESGAISQEVYNAKIAQFDSDLDKKKEELQAKQQKRENELATFQILTNTAQAVMKIWAQWGWPLGAVFGGLAAVAGVAQIAALPPVNQAFSGKYDVIGKQDGKTYSADYINNPGTGLLTGPAILAGELPEIIIDPQATQNLMINYPEAIEAIKESANLPQFAAGDYTKIPTPAGDDNISSTQVIHILSEDQKQSIDRFTDVMEDISKNGMEAHLVYSKYKKFLDKNEKIENKLKL